MAAKKREDRLNKFASKIQVGETSSLISLNLQKSEAFDAIKTQKTVNKPITNGNQSVNERLTKEEQTDSKRLTDNTETVNKPITNGNQSVNERLTKEEQTDSKRLTDNTETVNKPITNGNQSVNERLTKEEQTDSKRLTDNTETVNGKTCNISYDRLIGIQKDIINTLYQSSYSKITSKINLIEVSSSVQKSINIIKQSISRLRAKNVIDIYDRKDGRGGWCVYIFDDDFYLDMIKNLKKEKTVNNNPNINPIYNSNTTNTINKYSNDTKEQKPTTPQNDQLIDLIKKQNDQFQQQIAELQKQFLQQAPQVQPETKTVTVTDSAETNVVESDNDNWTDLDFSSLTEFGFTKRHVTQIKNFNKSLDADNQLTVNSVQESIEHYAWALQNRLDEMVSYAPANNRLRGLIGVLKKGGNWTEANYKSPEDLAFEASLIAKKERLEKIKAQKEEVLNLEFELWRESLTATELTDIEENGELQGKMPPSAFKNKGDNKHYVGALKSYFKNNVYKG
ncbi:hypothetical protein [Cysteiniphilum litorale]|uniref:Uncharacterized protein n=1 Tax=Cysteiniphilum litorale TaxID=2056700 RepID=A0A8J2Z687_9GAMM|nr:hypothetical protein [Cysteiniphilum litorale]GGG04966.1 hypothetical protein GCM10010995_23020 [Cysteiniphilum litorale]